MEKKLLFSLALCLSAGGIGSYFILCTRTRRTT